VETTQFKGIGLSTSRTKRVAPSFGAISEVTGKARSFIARSDAKRRRSQIWREV